MKNLTNITANSQGYVMYSGSTKPLFERYENFYQTKSNHKTKSIVKTIESLENAELNLIQKNMYRRLMYGLKEYTPEQISAMSPSTIKYIVNDHNYAKRIIQVMKAKKYYQAETKLFEAIFPQLKVTDIDYDWMLEVPREATLAKLKISTKDVIIEFIRRKILPKNFFELSPDILTL